MNIGRGPTFAAAARAAFEREFGGEVDEILRGMKRKTLEDPKKFASELYKTYGDGATRYLGTIVRYVESGNYHPEQDREIEQEEEELQSVIRETDPDYAQEESNYGQEEPEGV